VTTPLKCSVRHASLTAGRQRCQQRPLPQPIDRALPGVLAECDAANCPSVQLFTPSRAIGTHQRHQLTLRAKPHKFQIFQKQQALMLNLRLQIVFCIIAVIILILFSLV